MIQQEGPGWRLAHDSSRHGFPFLIGGEFWAVELTALEVEGLHALLVELDHQHTQIRDQLMEEESITLQSRKNLHQDQVPEIFPDNIQQHARAMNLKCWKNMHSQG